MANTLRFLKLQVTLQTTRNYTPIGYIGKKIRGALGNAMFTLFCVHPIPNCRGCKNQKSCVYGALFKNPEKSAEFPTFPAPYVIDAPYSSGKTIMKTGESLIFSITIFGEPVRWWQHVVLAIREMFENKKNQFNLAFHLKEIRSEIEDLLIYDGNNFVGDPMAALWDDKGANADINPFRLEIKFCSPLILKNARKIEPDFGWFIDAVFYRIACMVDIYEEREFFVPYGLLFRKPKVQTCLIDGFGDLQGINFEGNLSRYLPYIEIGAHLHIGKQSTYGYGKYQISKIF
jgi:hypothetical protein